jgi:hypothetical protein
VVGCIESAEKKRAWVAEAVFVVRGQVGSDGGTRLFAFACVCLLG